MRAEDAFEANFELLIDALDTDLAYIRKHTRLLTRAIEWQDNNRPRTDVLRGPELTATEGWLSISKSMDPQSAEFHDDDITFSRDNVSWIQRLIYSSIAAAFILGLAQKLAAEETARIANSKSVATFSLIDREKNSELSLLLATES